MTEPMTSAFEETAVVDIKGKMIFTFIRLVFMSISFEYLKKTLISVNINHNKEWADI